MKSFVPPFFNHFSFSLNRKKKVVMITMRNKTCGYKSHEKETKYIHTLAANLLHIRIGSLDWCKSGHCKNEAREIHCLFL